MQDLAGGRGGQEGTPPESAHAFDTAGPGNSHFREETPRGTLLGTSTDDRSSLPGENSPCPFKFAVPTATPAAWWPSSTSASWSSARAADRRSPPSRTRRPPRPPS